MPLLAILTGFVAAAIVGVAYTFLRVPAGWSGIVTVLAITAVVFLLPIQTEWGRASLIGRALGRGAADGRSWPLRTRLWSALASAVAVATIVIGVVAMPQIGHALDLAAWILVAAVLTIAMWVNGFWMVRGIIEQLTRKRRFSEQARAGRRRKREARRSRSGRL